jgi:hypothetical protein
LGVCNAQIPDFEQALKDNFEAIDFIFAFIKSSRELSVPYIKKLHT